jgi:hypothetical protein
MTGGVHATAPAESTTNDFPDGRKHLPRPNRSKSMGWTGSTVLPLLWHLPAACAIILAIAQEKHFSRRQKIFLEG